MAKKLHVNVNANGEVEEIGPRGRRRGQIVWNNAPGVTKPWFGRVRTIGTIEKKTEIIPPKNRRQKGECIAIAEQVFAKLFRRRPLVPAKEAISALSTALGFAEKTAHLRGAPGQIYALRDKLGYTSIRNLDTGEKFWCLEEVADELINNQD